MAIFCERYFRKVLLANDEYKAKNYKKALEETFVELDYMLINDEGFEKMKEIVHELIKPDTIDDKEIRGIPFGAGCTSCVVLVTKDKIICANSGDSRAVIGLKNGKLIELSYDHKPDNDGELKRVKAGGGFVEDGRV